MIEHRTPQLLDMVEFWAQYHTVYPDGFVYSDGKLINNPDSKPAKLAREICAQPDPTTNSVAWVNFSVFSESESDTLKLGESYIATSRRSLREIYFKPVSLVIEQGRLPDHTASWVAYLALDGASVPHPDRFEDLVNLLPTPRA
jgi:hypothetical protein